VIAAERAVAATLGWSFDALGRPAVEQAITAEARRAGLAPADWADRLFDGGEILGRLVDALAVPETWFLRQRSTFDALAALAAAQGGLRVLSAACSTGEEAWSAAACAPDVDVVGVDVSARALAVAAEGRYGEGSFRGSGAAARAWCDASGRVSDALRPFVRFQVANLVTGEGLAGLGRFDAILCRNLLIYLVPEARARLLGHLERLLTARGRVFVGNAESLGPPFERCEPAEAFAWKRAS
jgi:chemotaxis methyl-accepting protein methylase